MRCGNDGGQAFPMFCGDDYLAKPGMSLRDYFAAKALPAVMTMFADAVRNGECDNGGSDWRHGLAADAYKMADAMLRARED